MKRKILFSIVILTVAFSAGIALKTKAGVGDSGSGWLWGGSEEAPDGTISGNETGVGWISMNSTNCDADSNGFIDVNYCDLDNNTFVDVLCGGDNATDASASCGGDNATTAVVDYGVNIPAGNVNVSGEAWSENLGYINFDPAGDLVAYPGCGFPSLPCNSVQRNGNDLEGWARITDIQTELAAGNSGGWEGWIKMRSVVGDPVPYGVGISGANLTGQAWANREELGWIDFSRASIVVPKTLKICDDNCGSGFARDGASFSMFATDTKDLVACYTSTACLDPAPGVANNVTNAATWTETDAPDDAVSLAALAPNLQRVTAVSPGDSEQVDIDYNPGTGNINVNFTVNVANNILKVCQTNCASGTRVDGGVLNMEVSDTENLAACYGPQIGCTGGADVTNNASTIWDDTDVPADSVNFSSKGVIDANNIGIETVDVTYDPGTGNIVVNFNANVTASSGVGSDWHEVAP